MPAPRILIYHRVADDPIDAQLLCVSPRNFDSQMAHLARHFRVIPLRRQIEEIARGIIHDGTVSITFDDGYADNLVEALPILERYRLHATIFITSGMLGSKIGFWGDAVERILLTTPSLPGRLRIEGVIDISTANDADILRAHDELRRILRGQPAEIIWETVQSLQQWAGRDAGGVPERPVLDTSQLRRLAASPFIEIGAHTVTHTRLDVLPRERQAQEIGGSRQALESLLGRPVTLFAYPYGSADAYNRDSVDLVRTLGFEAGIANLQGDLGADSARFELPRRLVRDWTGDVFAHWMSSPDQSDAESRSLQQRARRLQAVRSEASGKRESAQHEGDTQSISEPTPDHQTSAPSVQRVVHINHYLGHGGAATSTLRLCRMQRELGVDARVLAEHVAVDVDFAQTFNPMPAPELTSICLEEGLLDVHLQGSHGLASHPWIENADIVHFQNLHGGYFNPLSIPLISARKPVVWTLRDMHSVTGHCAHSLDCEGWRTGCHGCPDLNCYPPVKKDNCNTLWELKRLAYACSRLQIVAPSRWIKEIAEQGLLAGHPVELIYNGVDLSVFRPIDKKEARQRLGLPADGILIGTAADYGLANPYKGGQHFASVAAALRSRYSGLTFVSIGSKQYQPGFSTDGILELPYIEGEGAMAAYYSALDFFLYTAIADTCPLVLIEAIACGLPVVAFRTGGVPEIARDGQEGLIAPYRDEQALFVAAEQMINASPFQREAYSRSARAHAERTFDIKRMRDAYLKLYGRTIERWHCSAPPPLPVDQLPELFRTDALLAATNHLSREANSAASNESQETSPSEILPKPIQPDPIEQSTALSVQGEALVEQGDIEGAECAFKKAIELGAALARPFNDLGAIHWHRGDTDTAIKLFSEGLAHQPDDWTSCANLADALLAKGQVDQARATLLAFAVNNPDSDEAVAAILSLPTIDTGVSSESGKPLSGPCDKIDIEIATSIAPFGIPAQETAIASWKSLGLRVVSVNTASEIAVLRPHFPDVRFVEATRTGQKIAGKPYIFIDDLMSALLEGGAQVCAIVNSDVILRAAPQLIARIATSATGGLVYGSRCEISSVEKLDGPLYRRGYDYFFFDRALIKKLPPSDYMLGVPWWDYWLPWAAISAGLPVWRYDAHVAFHVSHPVNYSPELTAAFGERFLQKSATPFMRRAIDIVIRQMQKMPFSYALADLVVAELSRKSRRLDPPTPPEKSKITAIVSTYASEEFIAECLEDLVGQTIADQIEVIVIDAASPENEGDIVRRYQEKHPNIRYHRTPERIGVYAAWNLAVRLARGEYLISCSTNDRLRPDALEILAATLDEHPMAALAYGNSYLTRHPHESFDDFTLYGCYSWGPATVHELLKAPGVGPHPMWRRSLHEEIGYFDESMKAIADQDFWLRIAAKYPLERIDDFTGLYYVDDQSLSGDRTTASSEIRLTHERHSRRYFYNFWQQDHRISKAHGEYYDRRHAERGKTTCFALCIVHDSDDATPLIATIQDLVGNYYTEAFILVLSRLPAPIGLSGGRIEWCQADTPSLALGWQILADGNTNLVADWVLGLAAGDKLAPHALLSLDEAILTTPEWELIYADEDTIASDGSHSDPCFKPGPDLTLLRETPYIGDVVAVSLASLRRFSADGFHNSPAAAYDLALRIAEARGTAVLGHLSDVLWHRPLREQAAQFREARLDALQHHLRRAVPDTELVPGLLPDTVHVRYPIPLPPPLQILVTCPDDRATVESFLTAFLEWNTYTDWRMTLIAPTAGRELADYLAAVADLNDPRLKIAQMASSVRQMAQLVHDEELLLIIDATARPLHKGWVEAMVEHVQRPGIGAVGARLVFPDGQISSAAPVFGFLGLQGSPYRGFPIEHPGNQHLLAHPQERTVLDPRCLVAMGHRMRDALAETVDITNDKVALVDACLRLRHTGLASVWTPYATLVVSGNARDQEPEDIAQVDEAPTPSGDEDRVLRRWLPIFPTDPAHNPNVSRARRGYKVEPDAALNWRPLPWRPVPKCVGYVADFAGCGYYRAIDPMDALARSGRIEGYVGSRGYIPAEIAQAQADTFIFQRQYKDEQIRLIEHHRRYSNALRVYELDDLITLLPKQSAFREGIPKDIDSRLKKALSLCDRLVVSTEPLAKAYGGYANETVVVPNYLPGWKWTHLTPKRRKSAKPRVGWAGALGHTGDLALIVEIVEALRDTVEWVFMGDIHPAAKSIVRERHPFVPIDQYPAALASLDLDIALAPLESNSFNEAKSHLKLLEYGVLGYPVICSDITPYQGKFPVTRLNNVPKKWIATIMDKISDREALRAEGEQLKQYVLDNWLLEDNGDVWLNAWTRKLNN